MDEGPEMGGWQIRRNWAWEYLIQIGLQDLVRPVEILTQLRQNAVVQVPDYAPQKEKERDTFEFGEWLRYRLLTSIEVFLCAHFHLFTPPSLQSFLLALTLLSSACWSNVHFTGYSDHHHVCLFFVCALVRGSRVNQTRVHGGNARGKGRNLGWDEG
jgi:hypothetical protein